MARHDELLTKTDLRELSAHFRSSMRWCLLITNLVTVGIAFVVARLVL